MSLDACSSHDAPPRPPQGRIHWAHVGVVAMHVLCCGLPLAVSAAGLAATATAGVFRLHAVLHDHELWLLAMSAALVAIGAGAEWRALRAGRQRRASLLFAASLACFALNATLILGHRLSA